MRETMMVCAKNMGGTRGCLKKFENKRTQEIYNPVNSKKWNKYTKIGNRMMKILLVL